MPFVFVFFQRYNIGHKLGYNIGHSGIPLRFSQTRTDSYTLDLIVVVRYQIYFKSRAVFTWGNVGCLLAMLGPQKNGGIATPEK
jgi:hypothetical protein